MKAKDIENVPPNILIYGPVGTQKTGLVSQASKGYMFDFDGGMQIALRLQDKFTSLRHNIEFDTYVDPNPTKPEMWMRAKKELMSIVGMVQAGTWPFDALIIDSLTGMAKAIQLQVMCNSGGALNKPEIQNWGSMVNEFEAGLTLLRACNVLRLVTAHELPVERLRPKQIVPYVAYTTPLSMTRPHSCTKLNWLFDEVWYTKRKLGAQGKVLFTVDGGEDDVNRSKSRRGLIRPVAINDIGLKGVLDIIGYNYENKH